MLAASGNGRSLRSASHFPHGAKHNYLMSYTVFLGNLPVWVTADDIKSWLTSENLVADAIKVIRNPETQESKGFAFIESPNQDEMNAIIRRFDRAPLEDRLLRANPAQPPKSGKGAKTPVSTHPARTAHGDSSAAHGTKLQARQQDKIAATKLGQTAARMAPPGKVHSRRSSLKLSKLRRAPSFSLLLRPFPVESIKLKSR